MVTTSGLVKEMTGLHDLNSDRYKQAFCIISLK